MLNSKVIMGIDIKKVREDFSILNQNIYNYPLVYFDNGATTQKPKVVIDTVNEWHSKFNSSIHRGVHRLSEKTTEAYEEARITVKEFIQAEKKSEVVFTSGTTGAINAVAFSFGEAFIKEGDEILITRMEHHANIVPWQMLCERKGAVLKFIEIDDRGELILDNFEELFTEKTKLFSFSYISNALGTINPVKNLIDRAHERNIPVLLDAAQAIQHEEINVQELDCDFLVFSGHKVYGPTGVGVLYGKEQWLEQLPPYQGGGDMVDEVTMEKTTYNELPFKFEAGTTNYIGAIGMAKALDYISGLLISNIKEYETGLLEYATEKLKAIDDLNIYGEAKSKASIISFLLEGIHQYDTGMVLDKMGIAVRTGTHCAQPLMQRYGIEGTVRASMCFYNTREEIDRLYDGLVKVKQMFG